MLIRLHLAIKEKPGISLPLEYAKLLVKVADHLKSDVDDGDGIDVLREGRVIGGIDANCMVMKVHWDGTELKEIKRGKRKNLR
jgi:hypothetical protein